MEKIEYVCSKCGCREYEASDLKTKEAGYVRTFEIQSKKFMLVSCKDCGYTEVYKKNWTM